MASVLLTAASAGHISDLLFDTFSTDWLQILGPWACNGADVYASTGLGFLAAELLRLRGANRGLGTLERRARRRQARRDFVRFLRKGMRG